MTHQQVQKQHESETAGKVEAVRASLNDQLNSAQAERDEAVAAQTSIQEENITLRRLLTELRTERFEQHRETVQVKERRIEELLQLMKTHECTWILERNQLITQLQYSNQELARVRQSVDEQEQQTLEETVQSLSLSQKHWTSCHEELSCQNGQLESELTEVRLQLQVTHQRLEDHQHQLEAIEQQHQWQMLSLQQQLQQEQEQELQHHEQVC